MRPPRAEELYHLYDSLDALKLRVSRLAAAAELAPNKDDEDAALAERLDDMGDRLSGALEICDEIIGGQSSASRGRILPRLPCLTLYPEWVPAFPLLGKDIENRGWWRSHLAGQLVGLHAGLQWGGSASRTARPRATDAVVRVARAAGASEAQIRAYQMAGLDPAWANLPGHIKVVVRISGAVRQAFCDPPEPWMLGATWAWRVERVHVLPEAVPVAGGWHRGLWRAPRFVAERVLNQLADL